MTTQAISIMDINQLRASNILASKIGEQLALMRKMKAILKKDRPLTDEVPLEVKSRSEFPTRQTYRAHVRAWAKQQVRFHKAYLRGDLAPHLIPLVEQG